jgi:hypothetical protein
MSPRPPGRRIDAETTAHDAPLVAPRRQHGARVVLLLLALAARSAPPCGALVSPQLNELPPPPSASEPVFILTRTSQRPDFFNELVLSIRQQTYKSIVHLVVADNEPSLAYARLLVPPSQVFKAEPVAGSPFDPTEPCSRCGATQDSHCAFPPAGSRLGAKRAAFTACFCSTGYPFNDYTVQLMRHVNSSGWVWIVDDDNVLADAGAVERAVAFGRGSREQPPPPPPRPQGLNASSTPLLTPLPPPVHPFVIFRAWTGRIIPSSVNWGKRVMLGDVDMMSFVFHTSLLNTQRFATKSRKRCFDGHLAKMLAAVAPPAWLPSTLALAHPLHVAGGGMAGHLRFPHVTVIMTGFYSEPLRLTMITAAVREYTSPAYASLVDKVIVVWNNVDAAPPDLPGALVLRMKKNDLNNRWTKTVPHIGTEAVLNLDDDIWVAKEAMLCMLSAWMRDPMRLVSHTTKLTEGTRYSTHDSAPGELYSFALPRALMLHRRVLELFSTRKYAPLRQLATRRDLGTSDDLALGLVAAMETRKAPLLIILPPRSVHDQFYACMHDASGKGNASAARSAVGGLALATDRRKMRSAFLAAADKLLRRHKLATKLPLHRSRVVYRCGLHGKHLTADDERTQHAVPARQAVEESHARVPCLEA